MSVATRCNARAAQRCATQCFTALLRFTENLGEGGVFCSQSLQLRGDSLYELYGCHEIRSFFLYGSAKWQENSRQLQKDV